MLHIDKRAPAVAKEIADAPQDLLLSSTELAAYLGVAPITLKRWRREGLAPRAIRTGLRTLRFRKSDVLAWLEERAEKTGA